MENPKPKAKRQIPLWLMVVVPLVTVGLAFTALLALAVPRTGSNLELALGIASIAKVALFATVIAGLAAVLPIRQVAGVDPAVVFRRGVAA